MSELHFAHWPKGLAKTLTVPQTTIQTNLEISALRYPNKPAIVYYDSILTYRDLLNDVEKMAGFLQQDCQVKKGDRVLLYMQNSPQFVIAYYAIMRADAIVVPVNPMNKADELEHYVDDTGASTVIVSQELYGNIQKHHSYRFPVICFETLL